MTLAALGQVLSKDIGAANSLLSLTHCKDGSNKSTNLQNFKTVTSLSVERYCRVDRRAACELIYIIEVL